MMTQIWENIISAFAAINWREVLMFYGLSVILFVPFEIYAFHWLKKKTKLISSMEEFINVSLASNAEAKKMLDEKEKLKGEQLQKQTDKPESMSVWEMKERQFITCLRMTVGDEYQCALSAIEWQSINGNHYWNTVNRFVSKVDENGKFKAMKVGNTDVVCGEKELTDDSRIIYYIEIDGKIKNWPGEKEYDNVINASNIDKVKMENRGRKILTMDLDKKTIRYKGDKDCKSIVYQYNNFDKESPIVRSLVEIKAKRESLELIRAALDERMKRLEVNINEQETWYHQTEDGNSVDLIAFVKMISTDTFLFGIGRTWKADAKLEEIKQNYDMINRSFVDCMTKSEDNAMKVYSSVQDNKNEEKIEKAEPEKDTNPTKIQESEPEEETKEENPSDDETKENTSTTEEGKESVNEDKTEPESGTESTNESESNDSSQSESETGSDEDGSTNNLDLDNYETESNEDIADEGTASEEDEEEDDGSKVDTDDPFDNVQEDGTIE